MKKLLLTAFMTVSLFNANLFSQTRDFSKYEHKHAFHKPWIGNNRFLTDYIKNNGLENASETKYCIPVKFYVFGKNNAPTLSDVKETLQNLNSIYAQNNTLLSFSLYDIKYIKKKKFDKFGYYGQFPFQSIFRHNSKVINVFLVSSLKKPGKKNKNVEYTGACNNVNGTVVISTKNDASVISHEVGHFFKLKHPHKNSDKGKHRQEAVDRDVFRGGLFVRGRNCEINGDGLYDTEAQPHLVKNTDKNCNYTSPDLTDRWGKKYAPQTDNIMSYTLGKQCRRVFTPMQKAVMLYNTSTYKNADKWAAKASMSDKFEPDFDPQIANVLQDKVLQEHTFHKTYVKKSFSDEDVDFVKFTLGKKVNAEKSKIVITGKAALKAEFFTMQNNELQPVKEFSKEADSRTEISLKDFKNGTYFVKISQTKKSGKNDETNSYSISLNLDRPTF